MIRGLSGEFRKHARLQSSTIMQRKFESKGIAAANVEVEGTDVSAVTIHSLFDLDSDTYNTKLDFAKKSHKVQVLVALDHERESVRAPHVTQTLRCVVPASPSLVRTFCSSTRCCENKL